MFAMTIAFAKRSAVPILLLTGLLAAASGCRQTDMRHAVIRTPGMVNEVDGARIREALQPLRGIRQDDVVFDYRAGTVEVHYDSMMLALKNIEHAIAEAGFDANELTADPQAHTNRFPSAGAAAPSTP